MFTNILKVGLFGFVGLAMVTSCKDITPGAGTETSGGASKPIVKKDDGTPVLAQVGDSTITVGDFERKINAQSPFIRARYNTDQRRKEFLENMVRFEIQAQEAIRLGLDQDPEVLETFKKSMVQKLIRSNFDDKIKREDITDDEVRKYYDEHLDDYHKPEKVRIAHILVKFGDDRGAALTKAEEVLAQAQTAAGDRAKFRDLVRQHSQDSKTKHLGGALRYLSREELTKELGDVVAEAAFGLEKAGDISGLIEGRDGFEILQLSGRRQAVDRDFEKVAGQIRNRLYRQKRSKLYDEWVNGLREQYGVTLSEENLSNVTIDTSKPAPPAGRRMGGPGGPAGPRPSISVKPAGAPNAPAAPKPVEMDGPKGQ